MNKKNLLCVTGIALTLLCVIGGKKSLRAMQFAEHDLVTIVTQDNQKFLVPLTLVKTSITLANLIEDAGTNNPLPLPNISGEIWQLLQDKLAGIALIAQEPSQKESIQKQIATQLKTLPSNTLIACINAANYLDIHLLLELGQSEAINRDPVQIHQNDLLSLPKEIRSSIIESHALKLAGPILITNNKELKGHTHQVTSVCVTPDGSKAISGAWDKTIRIWDINTGAQIAILQGHTGPVYSVCATPDGSTVVSGSKDKTIRIWNSTTGWLYAVLQGHTGAVYSVCTTPDSSKIVSGSYDDTIRIWDIRTGTQLANLQGQRSAVMAVCVTPDSSKIISGSHDNTIRIWDTDTLTQRATLKGHSSAVISVCVTPDGSTIISGSSDQTIRIWDIDTGTQLAILKGHTSLVKSVYVTPDGNKIISGAWDKTIRIWDIHTGKQLAILRGHTFDVTSVCITRDGKKIISGSNDNTIRIWDMPLLYRWTNTLNQKQLISLWQAIQKKNIQTIRDIRDATVQPSTSSCAIM